MDFNCILQPKGREQKERTSRGEAVTEYIGETSALCEATGWSTYENTSRFLRATVS
jgi:hypothetical protein